MTTQQKDDDLIHDIIKKLILQVDGVVDVTIQRKWDGFHLAVSPKSGQSEKELIEQIQSTLESNFPPLAKLFRVSVEGRQSERTDVREQPRIELERVDFSSNPERRFLVTVKLSRSGKSPVEITKEGAYHIENVVRLAAEATLEAALTFFPEQTDGTILGTKHVEIAYENLVVVLLTLNLREGQITASGSASMRKGSHFGAVAATLKAINRYLEFYDRD